MSRNEELSRTAALGDILDSGPEPCFDRITRLAASVLNVPIAVISLVDGERAVAKSAWGMDVGEMPREFSLGGQSIPVETVAHVASVATAHNKIFILNPAPTCALNDELLKHVSIITPNETEASMLTGIKVTDAITAEQAAWYLHAKGIATIIITLGSKGALVLHGDKCTLVQAPVVHAVDTTAAGDVFNGALAVALSQNKAMLEAVEFACKAAAISVTRLGAQASAPYKHEL